MASGQLRKEAIPQNFARQAASLQPGDTLVLRNGEWPSAQLHISASGTSQQPIVIAAETAGQVVCTGNSSLRIGGAYCVVSGLLFTRGFCENGATIEYQYNGQNARHSRVTDCAIVNYNPPSRLKEDHWIAMFGNNNRFDHNYIAAKKNTGTTLIVALNDADSRPNHHLIDSNYFGERPRLGSNGGETIRIGTSTYSRSSSATIIRNNFFYRCSGEVEIVSIKSCDNILEGNTFAECEGSVVLRHGNRNIIRNNYFIGNGKPHTGGVRVINADHVISGNVFIQLAGTRFRAALAVLNGVPNSPINRYDQVQRVRIDSNLFIDCRTIEWCAGKDFERTATPQKVQFANNYLYQYQQALTVVANDDISGFTFAANITNKPLKNIPGINILPRYNAIKNERGHWLKNELPITPPANEQQTGCSFMQLLLQPSTAYNPKSIAVAAKHNELLFAANTAMPGDTLIMAPGVHLLSASIIINKPLTILAKSLKDSVHLQFEGKASNFSFFQIANGGHLTLSGLHCNGQSAVGLAESFIRTASEGMIEHYQLKVTHCSFNNITDGRKHAFKANKGSYADSIIFENCSFNDISGEAISIAAEKEDKGVYNAEYIRIVNCSFYKILVGAIDVYRGGNDESTTGPYFFMNHCSFNEVGNVELCAVVRLYGVQFSSITNCSFVNSGRAGRAVWYEDFGWTSHKISHCNLYASGIIQSFYPNIKGVAMSKYAPLFLPTHPALQMLSPKSELRKKGSDGKDIGVVYQQNILQL